MIRRTASLLGIVAGCSLLLTAPAAIAQTETELDGLVTEVNNAAVPGAGLETVGTDGRKFVTRTASDGTYAFSVPPGVYRIRVVRTGFCDALRAPVALAGQKQLRFDFQLLVCPIEDFEGPRQDFETPQAAAPDSTPRYHDDELGPVTPNGLRPVVSYGKRETGTSSVRYSSLAINGRQLPVIYTYDLLTIKADNMVYSALDSSIRATGHVVWQDGGTTRNGSVIEISFECYKPKITFEK